MAAWCSASASAAWECVRCGGKTRKGTPCQLLSEAGRRRCNLHGSMSTCPRAKGGARGCRGSPEAAELGFIILILRIFLGNWVGRGNMLHCLGVQKL